MKQTHGVVAVAVAFALAVARLSSQTPEPKPSFDVISIKPATAAVTAADPAPSLLTAIQELGMKLEPSKGPVEVLVIDSAEKPTEN